MITWNEFVWFALPALLCWIVASALAAWKPTCTVGGKGLCDAARISRESDKSYQLTIGIVLTGLCVYAAFIILFWMGLQRPPLRTLGETRLWYAFFMMLSGVLTYMKWRYRWIMAFSCIVSAVFILLNILCPEIHDRSLMPALQSYWFVPHVTVYIFAYSVLGCAFLLAVAGLARHTDKYLPTTDQLVYIGVAFLTFGMLSGALWAKQAWGDYWNWDPKETWAAVTWSLYLLYIHLRLSNHKKRGHILSYILLILAFIALQMSWYGVNYLPSAQNSLHMYMN